MIDVQPYSKEKPLFVIAACISALIWFALIVGTLGIALVYLLLGFVFYAFVQSGFTSYLHGTAVRISSSQYPELHGHYLECCKRLEVKEPPDLYMLQADGLLNALALKFLFRNYVVVFSSIVDALEESPQSLRFYFGHELCHVVRGHLTWSFWLWPAKILPVLGPAYARAQETSCDFYGLACCESSNDAVRAMAAIACGPEQWRKLNVAAYQEQVAESGKFWMSFHELTSGYPWLTKRVARIVALSEGREPELPRRSVLAGILSIFFPNLGINQGGGIVSLMIVVAIVGILAAVAIPAYQDYTVRARMQGVMPLATELSTSIANHVDETGQIPENLAAVGVQDDYSDDVIQSITMDSSSAIFTITLHGGRALDGKTMVFVPYREEGTDRIRWQCSEGSLEAKYRPAACRPR